MYRHSYEEAIAIVQSWNGQDVALWEDEEKVVITEEETLYETTEALSPEENHGQATIEVFEMMALDFVVEVSAFCQVCSL